MRFATGDGDPAKRRPASRLEIRAPREFHASLGRVHGPELQLRLPQWDNHAGENGHRHGIHRRQVVPKLLQARHLHHQLLSS